MTIYKKKYAVGILLFTLLVLFIGFQYLFLKNIFGINPFARDILSKGFCKDCNVILISLDTLRAKDIPCYGYGKNTSPNLCAFAKKSFLFKNTYSTASKTLDSHFSIFTSLYPKSHNMITPFVSVLSDKVKTLTQMLKENGYNTYFIGSTTIPHIPLDKGFERGFDKIIDNGGNADLWEDNLKENIKPDKGKFFAFLHTSLVHEPYIPKKENISKFYNGKIDLYISWDEYSRKIKEKVQAVNNKNCLKYTNTKDFAYCYQREYDNQYQNQMKEYWDTFSSLNIDEKKEYVQALYDAEIYEQDEKIKKLLDYLDNSKLLDKTIVIFTSDHGEEFYEHGGWTHAFTLYNEVVHVPLIMHVPKAQSGIIDKLSSSVDIYPSILGLLGIKVSQNILGINLFSTFTHNFVFAEHVNSDLYSIISPDFQYLRNSKTNKDEMYNLVSDPDEKTNILNQNPETRKILSKELEKHIDTTKVYESGNQLPFPTWIDEDQRKKLIKTGYF